MASTIIHAVVGSEINKTLKRKETDLLIGSISPDLSRIVGEPKEKSHFLDFNNDIPNIDRFLDKYKRHFDDDFVLGYYIHLYTDYLWFKYFIPEIYDENKNMITKLDGSIINCHGHMVEQYIYNDYTNLNLELINKYKLNTDIFYKDIPEFKPFIEEIPMDKINLLINKSREIIENTKTHKDMVFNIENIDSFISMCISLITANLKELNIK